MNTKHSMIGLLVASVVLGSPLTVHAACFERIYPTEAQGRNAWAELWGYLLPGQAATLNAQGLYVEFTTGCYRLASGQSCNPIIPVLASGSFIPGLMPSSFCPRYNDCFTPEQRILVEGEYIGIEDAAINESRTVTTLAADASPENPSFSEQRVETFTWAPIAEDVIVLEGESGERLEVTGPHPVVMHDGSVVPAKTLEEGDMLFAADGQLIRLAKISSYFYEGNVWNVQPVSREKADNILVAEGLLTGSMLFQEQWGHDKFRLFVRDKVDVEQILADR